MVQSDIRKIYISNVLLVDVDTIYLEKDVNVTINIVNIHHWDILHLQYLYFV